MVTQSKEKKNKQRIEEEIQKAKSRMQKLEKELEEVNR